MHVHGSSHHCNRPSPHSQPARIVRPLPLPSRPQTHLSANYAQRWQHGAAGLPPEIRLPRDGLAGVRLLQVGAPSSGVCAPPSGTTGVLFLEKIGCCACGIIRHTPTLAGKQGNI